MPAESFADPTRGLAPDAKVEKLLEDILEERPKAQTTASWPQVNVAIRRGGLFVIEADTPAFKAMLKFDPDRPGVGDYEIRHHQPRTYVEKGHIERVKPVAADEQSHGLSMLTQFAARFMVFSVGSARPHTRMVWLVGLREFRTVDEGDPE